MNIKPMPNYGYITRSGRKVYGQNDLSRQQKYAPYLIALTVSLAVLVTLGVI